MSALVIDDTTSLLAKTISHRADKNFHLGFNTIVSICGGSCTGKSTQVSGQLAKELGDSQVISQDHFMLSSIGRTSDQTYGWDHPSSFNIEESAAIMDNLREGIYCSMPNYSFQARAYEGVTKLLPSKVVFFEGLYAGYGFLRDHADYVVYVEMPLYARIIRRLVRNLYERYVNSNPRFILAGYLGGPLKAHNDFVVQQKEEADIVVRPPYDFQESIKRFDLKPQPDQLTLQRSVFEFLVDVKTGILMSKQNGAYRFHVCHEGLDYLRFDIEESTYDQILTLDLHSV